MEPAALTLSDLSKTYGSRKILEDIQLNVRSGEFMTLVGPSGCGKSTLLKIIAGLEQPSSGQLSLAETDVTRLSPSKRELAMVFQNYALYPHMSVAENISMPLVMRELSFWQRFPVLSFFSIGARAKRADILKRVQEIAEILEISAFLNRRPGELSGGQRQRVALGRAIIREPSLFLMDEPLSNLDARLRLQMRDELTALHKKLGVAFMYVTHDQIEAMTMSDRIAVMMGGRIVQLGTPSEVYDRPASLDVARFFGSSPINVFQGQLDGMRRPVVFNQTLPMHLVGDAGETIHIAIRPEDLRFYTSEHTNADMCTMQARLMRREDHGPEMLMHLQTLDETPIELRMRLSKEAQAVKRDSHSQQTVLKLAFPLESLQFFDQDGSRLEVIFPPSKGLEEERMQHEHA